jgi:predicted RNA-binding Zn-ribbon protein involved in translation (DUF1610 family)
MSEPASCPHTSRRLVAQDEHETYFECLDCGAILEADELPPSPAPFDDSLSDA